jgi:hypothetical protein
MAWVWPDFPTSSKPANGHSEYRDSASLLLSNSYLPFGQPNLEKVEYGRNPSVDTLARDPIEL